MDIRYSSGNRVCSTFQKYLTFLLFGSRITLILFSHTNFALYCTQKQNKFSKNFSCSLVFPNVAQRKITFPLILVVDLSFPIDSFGLLRYDFRTIREEERHLRYKVVFPFYDRTHNETNCASFHRRSFRSRGAC